MQTITLQIQVEKQAKTVICITADRCRVRTSCAIACSQIRFIIQFDLYPFCITCPAGNDGNSALKRRRSGILQIPSGIRQASRALEREVFWQHLHLGGVVLVDIEQAGEIIRVITQLQRVGNISGIRNLHLAQIDTLFIG